MSHGRNTTVDQSASRSVHWQELNTQGELPYTISNTTTHFHPQQRTIWANPALRTIYRAISRIISHKMRSITPRGTLHSTRATKKTAHPGTLTGTIGEQPSHKNHYGQGAELLKTRNPQRTENNRRINKTNKPPPQKEERINAATAETDSKSHRNNHRRQNEQNTARQGR